MTIRRRFIGRPQSVTAARHFTRDVLKAKSVDILDAVELMVSELATNSVRHAGSDFEITIEDSRRQIRVEVRDTGRGRPALQNPAPQEPSGRGLRIVKELSDAWGIISASEGKTVWFTLGPDSDGSVLAPRTSVESRPARGSSNPGLRALRAHPRVAVRTG